SWGKTERQEMKELARVNEVNVTTHATPNMGGGGASFSGFTGRDFSDEARQKAVDEMARAAEFAADVGGGGPVVFHMDGFPRPVFSAGFVEGEKKEHFRQFEEEKKKAPLYFVDSRTGKVQAVSREQEVFMPPEKDPKTGDYKLSEDGYPLVRPMNFDEVADEYEKLTEEKKKEVNYSPFNYFYKQLKLGQTEEMEARREEYMENVNRFKNAKKKFEVLLKEYGGAKNAENPDRAKKIFVNMLINSQAGGEADGNEEAKKIRENPEEFLKNKLKHYDNEKTIFETGVLGYTRQIENEREEIKAYQDITSYGVDKEADTIAESAMRTLKIEEKKKLDKPLWVAPENWAVEMYGSHPREYRNIITKSREKMAEKLQKTKGYSKNEANKVAEDHIRGTFDIGHLNMWKKY
ncbi:MAG: hypothetical protein U1B79_00310, partial [Candidatus Pacearchaeota archaeon]|nr:hypothetical protein [Candidatus Pacearchaeota archaeon]